jgi:hypothetical protein
MLAAANFDWEASFYDKVIADAIMDERACLKAAI